MYPRRITAALLDALSDTPVVFLNGARQTGKSTLVQQLASGPHRARYLTLDDIGVLSAAKADPQGFLAGLAGPVILDEVQRAPELFLPLKAEVDRDRTAGRFLLTGSADALVLPRLADSLTGRMEILTLWPLSQGEIEGKKSSFIETVFSADTPLSYFKPLPPPELWARIAQGGYPEVLSRPRQERRTAWVGSYLKAIVERDIRDIADIEGLTLLPRLLNLLAARTASLMNYAELSRSMGLPQTTLKRYLALLEAAFLVELLPPWNGNLSKRLVKAPKLFLNDTGLTVSLLDIDAQRLASSNTLSGPLLENFVMAELAKQASWSKTKPRLYHFRTQAGQEVDIVLEDAQGRCIGIEVKAGSVGSGDIKGLKTLEEVLGKRFLRGIILHGGPATIPLAKNMHALPIGALWRQG